MPPAEPKVLADLLEISQTLASALDIRSALGRVLEHIEQSLGAVSATVALREGDSDELAVEAAVGAGWQKARQRPLQAGRRHHRPRRRERQADRRPGSQPRAPVPQPHGGPGCTRQG